MTKHRHTNNHPQLPTPRNPHYTKISSPHLHPASTTPRPNTPTFNTHPPPNTSTPTSTSSHTMSEFYVYYCEANAQVPYAHWKFVPTTTPQQQLPDIRFARPIYTWSSVTNVYIKVRFSGVLGKVCGAGGEVARSCLGGDGG